MLWFTKKKGALPEQFCLVFILLLSRIALWGLEKKSLGFQNITKGELFSLEPQYLLMFLCLPLFVFTHVCRSNNLTCHYWALVFIQRGWAVGAACAAQEPHCGGWMMTRFTRYIEPAVCLFPSNLLFPRSRIEPPLRRQLSFPIVQR